VLDLPHPHLVEDVAAIEPWWEVFRRAPLVVHELHTRAAAWDLAPPRVLTWMSPRLAVSIVGSIDRDGFGRLTAAVRELAYEKPLASDAYTRPPVELWHLLAEHRIRWPRETDSTYYPGVWVPDAWVGRAFDELPNPFEPLADLLPGRVVALGGDHAVLVLP
jgi:hypothetical protein